MIPVILLKPLLPNAETMIDIGVRVVLAIALGWVGQRLMFMVIGRVESWLGSRGKGAAYAHHRARTLCEILRNLTTVLVVVVVVARIISVIGWDVRPLLAGAGLLGVALGFGAQTLVRDVIAGIFILTEDQFAVGDVIEVNGKPATVEALSVRSTTLRDFNGRLYFVPNGEMKIVVNHSRGWHRLAVDVPVAADQDLEKAIDVCESVAKAMNNESSWRTRLLDPIEVWGVEQLSGVEAHVRLVVRANPGPDATEAARELRRRVVPGLIRAGIRLGAQREITIGPLTAAAAAAREPE